MGRTFPRKQHLVRRWVDGSPDAQAEAKDELDAIFGQARAHHVGARKGPRAQDLPPVDPETIPVYFHGPVRSKLFFPATPDDLTEIMRRLPPLSINGLEGVLLVIKQAKRGPVAASQVVPGFFSSRRAGTYSTKSRIIRLFPYAGLAKLTVPTLRKLKIDMLSTFVHEVAHHVDWLMRAGRLHRADIGRSKEKREAFAERMQMAWTQDIVVPYVRALTRDQVEFF